MIVNKKNQPAATGSQAASMAPGTPERGGGPSSSSRAIHQLVAGYSRGDAISNEARTLRSVFRGWGYASDIYCEERRILPELRRDARDVKDLVGAAGPQDVVLLHLSIGSIVNEIFPTLDCRKALLYHNITPPEFLRGIQQQIAFNLAKGREQAAQLAGVAEVVMADSRYNAEELAAWCYGPATVLPLVLDLERLTNRIDRATRKEYDDGLINILFVGRCVPNKRIEDILAAFYYFQRYVEPRSRLIHVGSFAGTERYNAILLTQARDMELRDVEFVGAIPQDRLNALYASAHVFLSMSEHEGFCIPLIESMAHDLPVLAYAAGAVPETLDGAGVLFHEKRFDLVAEMMGRLAQDGPLRKRIIARQRVRLERYRTLNLEARLRETLAPLLDT